MARGGGGDAWRGHPRCGGLDRRARPGPEPRRAGRARGGGRAPRHAAAPGGPHPVRQGGDESAARRAADVDQLDDEPAGHDQRVPGQHQGPRVHPGDRHRHPADVSRGREERVRAHRRQQQCARRPRTSRPSRAPAPSWWAAPRSGLVYPFDFPDPDVILVGQTYYAYATNSVAGNIQIIDSTDLTHWTAVGNALPSPARVGLGPRHLGPRGGPGRRGLRPLLRSRRGRRGPGVHLGGDRHPTPGSLH